MTILKLYAVVREQRNYRSYHGLDTNRLQANNGANESKMYTRVTRPQYAQLTQLFVHVLPTANKAIIFFLCNEWYCKLYDCFIFHRHLRSILGVCVTSKRVACINKDDMVCHVISYLSISLHFIYTTACGTCLSFVYISNSLFVWSDRLWLI